MAEQEKGAIVITGASTGIGKKCALLLDRSGYRVFAGVRSSLAGERLKREASDRLSPIMMDVTNSEQIISAYEAIREVLSPGSDLSGIINNAGIIQAGPLEFFPIDRFRKELEINVIGQIAVTQAFLPLIRKSKGRIINISSASGCFATPFMGPYAASKFAMEALTDALRREMRRFGVHVSVIEPGAIDTPIWDKSISEADEIESEMPAHGKEWYGERLSVGRRIIDKLRHRAISPEVVARVVKQALETSRPRARYLVGHDARLQALMGRFLPESLSDWIVDKALMGRFPGVGGR